VDVKILEIILNFQQFYMTLIATSIKLKIDQRAGAGLLQLDFD